MSKATDAADKIIHAAIYDVALMAAEKAAIAEAPFLGLPVIRQVFHYLLMQMADLIYPQLDNMVDFKIIDTEVGHELITYNAAKDRLRMAVLPTQGEPDAAEIENAKADFKKRLADLIHLPQ